MINKLIIIFTFGSIYFTLAQTITGKVYDKSSEEPLIGVNVILNNNNGSTTNANGEFSLSKSNDDMGNTITFKYIGYKTVKTLIPENNILNIWMETESQNIETVVISAGKFEQKLEEITVSMEVIRPSLIENRNTTNIQTAMDQIPGVNITDGQANIRGGSGWSYGAGSRVLVMVDDMPLISGDAGQVQWKLIATENINQVEVIKGASSVLYGSSALNGIINIRTSFPKSSEIDKVKSGLFSVGYTKINSHYGITDNAKRDVLNWWGERRQKFYGTEFSHSRKIGNLDLTIGGNYFKDEGYRKDEITDRKRFNFNAKYHSNNISGLSFGVNGNFLFQSTGSAIIWNGLNQAYIPLDSAITTTNGDTYNIDPFIEYITENNRHTLKTRYLKVINDNSTAGEDNDQDNESETYYSDYQWQHKFKSLNLRITTGATNEIVFARSDLFNGNNFRKNHALYSQFDKKWGKVNLSFGSRYEHFTIQSTEKYYINGDSINKFVKAKPVFRAGINYQIAQATFLRSSWGQGFRFPSMAELFIRTDYAGLQIFSNPELKAETGWSSEIGIKQGLKYSNWLGFLDIAGFLMEYDDMMEFSFGAWGELGTNDPLDLFGFKSINVGKTRISGLEISLNGIGKMSPDATLNILAGYTYMNPISLNPENAYGTYPNGVIINGDSIITYANSSTDPSVLKYRYQNIAKLDFEINYKKVSIGSGFRYNDFMKNIDYVFVDTTLIPILMPALSDLSEAREKFKHGDFIIDLRASYQINSQTKLSIIINNLLNTEYMSRPANMMPPRTFAIQCSLKL